MLGRVLAPFAALALAAVTEIGTVLALKQAAQGADEIAHGNVATGIFDAGTAFEPFGSKGARRAAVGEETVFGANPASLATRQAKFNAADEAIFGARTPKPPMGTQPAYAGAEADQATTALTTEQKSPVVKMESTTPDPDAVSAPNAAKSKKPSEMESALPKVSSEDINEPSFLSVEEFKTLPKNGTIDPKNIRFSQDSIKSRFKAPHENQSFDDFIQGVKEGSIKPEPIRLVERDGQIFTLDNRRLYAYQKEGLEIEYVKLNNVPKRQLFKFTTENDGTAISIRDEK
jgi:hypothetical protein